jgi:outer membrane protein assembly factor BamA
MKSLVLLLIGLACGGLACAQEEPQRLVVQELRCKGNVVMACRTILESLYLREGGAVDENEIQDAKLRLAALTAFESVDIYLEKGSRPGRAVVVVSVVEANPYATEFLFGASARSGGYSQALGARLGRQNVFGTGSALDLTVSSLLPIDDPARRSFLARLEYLDPTAFGSRRYFAVAGITQANSHRENANGDFNEFEQTGFDISVGRRILDYAYFRLGYSFSPRYRRIFFQDSDDPEIDPVKRRMRHSVLFGYGRNSEDDPYFPTNGARLDVNVDYRLKGGHPNDDDEVVISGGFQSTRSAGNTVLTVRVGTPGTEYHSLTDETFGVSFAVARPWQTATRLGATRARWYVEPGFTGFNFSVSEVPSLEVGIKLGVRLETKTLGIVNLYAFGTTNLSDDVFQ